MFLAELHIEEREAFLELAALIAKIDGNLSIYENSFLNKYKKEMNLEDYKIKGLSMDDSLKMFKTERSKNIVLAELFQLIYSDGVLQDQEKESLLLIKKHFGFAQSDFGSFKDWIDKIKQLSVSEGELS